MSGHTKGPWKTDGDIGYGETEGTRVRDGRGYILAVAIGDVPELAPVENANLIAAAPDMYEALKVLADKAYTKTELNIDEVKAAFEALEKAEGK